MSAVLFMSPWFFLYSTTTTTRRRRRRRGDRYNSSLVVGVRAAVLFPLIPSSVSFLAH